MKKRRQIGEGSQPSNTAFPLGETHEWEIQRLDFRMQTEAISDIHSTPGPGQQWADALNEVARLRKPKEGPVDKAKLHDWIGQIAYLQHAGVVILPFQQEQLDALLAQFTEEEKKWLAERAAYLKEPPIHL